MDLLNIYIYIYLYYTYKRRNNNENADVYWSENVRLLISKTNSLFILLEFFFVWNF
jgi:heme/copper-type cytochrome/quinol oxidase subunit 2